MLRGTTLLRDASMVDTTSDSGRLYGEGIHMEGIERDGEECK
jgi:hypothetical protein